MKTNPIASNILKYLNSRQEPVAVREITFALKESHDPWDIKRTIWELTADSLAEITWDWKLKAKASTAIEP